jgi:predicted transcriptional regulator of viral defense system
LAVAGSVDTQVAALAHRQHGNITREQLLGLGLSATAISKRVRRGRLHRVHLGVYAVGRPPKTALERAAAAVLACGPRAALCGPSAFTLWGFDKQWRFPLHVCSPFKRRRPGIVTHRFPSLGGCFINRVCPGGR